MRRTRASTLERIAVRLARKAPELGPAEKIFRPKAARRAGKANQVTDFDTPWFDATVDPGGKWFRFIDNKIQWMTSTGYMQSRGMSELPVKQEYAFWFGCWGSDGTGVLGLEFDYTFEVTKAPPGARTMNWEVQWDSSFPKSKSKK